MKPSTTMFSQLMLAAALAVGSTGLAGLGGVQAQAGQGGTPVAPAGGGQQDLSRVQIKATRITDNFSTLEGQGGTIGVLWGPDGVLMVDSQYAALTEKIVAAIRQISPGQLRFLINTHLHGDHTGGNENLGKLGVTILAREELRSRLAAGSQGRPGPAASLPVVTYRGPISFRMNGEEVRAIPVPAAHTDGDTIVRFLTADILMTGDIYRGIGYPNIDRANGGSLPGILGGLNAIIDQAGPTTKIIPGHGSVVDKSAVAAHRDMIATVRDRVAALVRQGKTQDEVIASKPTADFDARIPDTEQNIRRFVGQLYMEIKGA